MGTFNFLKAYQDTILSIIEDKPKFEIPKAVFKCIILISFMQIGMYLFSDFKLMSSDDLKLQSAFNISEMVSLVNILNQKESDNLSIFVYFIMQGFMVLYFIYVAFLTLIKQYLQEFYKENEGVFIQINELLNLYFTFYINVFLTQYIELNCSLIFCSSKSLISIQRKQASSNSVCTIPPWQAGVAVVGIFLTLITAFITSYYFRNYEFLEKNALKRKFTLLFLFLMGIRIIITFIDFSENLSSGKELKHLICQVYGIVSIVDYFHSIPFTDQEISRYYLMIIAYFECIVTCANFLILTNYINGSDMFYMCIIGSLVVSACFKQALNYQFEEILQGHWDSGKIIPQLDYYLEQICLLGERGIYDENSKFILQKSYRLHRFSCQILTCICHKYPVLNMKMMNDQQFKAIQENGKELQDRDFSHLTEQNINQKLVYKFIDGLFQWMFSQKCINQNTYEFEKLSLKYISFMVKFQNNPVRAYYELKVLQLKKSTFSVYFKMITNIIGQNIKHQIETSKDEDIGNIQSGKIGGVSEPSKLQKRQKSQMNIKNIRTELNVTSLVGVELICFQFIPTILTIIEQKYDLWMKLQNGYKSMNDFQVDAIKLMKKVSLLKTTFNKEIKTQTQLNPDIENNIQFKKLNLIYFLFVLNDIMKAINVELQISELKKRDSLAEHEQLKNTSLIKGDICILEVSLSKNFGKIVSKKNEKTAAFFGFQSKEDFLKVSYINELMPSFISKAHNQLMKNYIMGMSSRAKTGSQTLTSFIKQNDGYIFPVKLHFDFSFISSEVDFRLNGILLKNRAEQDYFIFHRSGKVCGMTKHLAKILFQDFNKIPDGETANSRLHALVMFPKIMKKIASFKNQILEDLMNKVQADQISVGESSDAAKSLQTSSSTMTNLIEDSRGSITFSQNPFSAQTKFMNYLAKKQAFVPSISSTSRKLVSFDEIDVLEQDSLRVFREFQNNELDQSTNRSHNKDSDRFFITNRNAQKCEQQQFDDFNMVHDKKFMTYVSRQSELSKFEYKMNFEYQVQYCYINQGNSSINKQSTMSQQYKQASYSNQKTKDIKQQKLTDDFQDIFFLIRIENIVTKQKKKKVKYNAIQTFIRNLAKYLSSTSSILQFSSSCEKYLNLRYEAIEAETKQSPNNKNNNTSTQADNMCMPQISLSTIQEDFMKFPKKMLKQLQTQIFNTDEEQEEDNQKQQQYQQQESSRKKGSSFKTENSKTEFTDGESDINFEKLYIQIATQITKNKQAKEQLEKFTEDLDNLISINYISRNQLFSIDPNYQVKKLLQKKTLCFQFSKSLEYSFIEHLFLHEQEKRGLKDNSPSLSPLLKSQIKYEEVKFEEQQMQMTFRQEFDQQSNLTYTLERIPSHNLAILESNTNRIGFQKHFLAQIDPANQALEPQQKVIDLDLTPRSDQFQLDDATPATRVKNETTDLSVSGVNITINQHLNNTDMEKLKQYNDQTTIQDISARPILDLSHSQLVNEKVILEPLIERTESVSKNQQSTAFDRKYFSNSKEELYGSNNLSMLKVVNPDFKMENAGGYPKSNKLGNQSPNNDNKFNSINNSTQKVDNDNQDSNDIAQEKAVAQLLNQKGMVTGKNSLQRASVNSSTRTSSSYAGIFLKEIILKCKIPISANQYKIILILFLLSFIGLNITNLVIIQSDMGIFSSNVAILRQPRKFLRDFGKACFGFYLSLEYQLGYLHETDGSVAFAFNEYMTTAIVEYSALIEQYSIQLTQLKQAQPVSNGLSLITFQVFKERQQETTQVDYSLLFDQQQYYILTISPNFTTTVRNDAFLYLRQNYFNFSSQVQDTVNFLVSDTLNAVDSLINKFTIVIICAIFGIIFVGIISLPVIKAINVYEEKIMMIVTRINYDSSEMEKCKLSVCKQLINIDFIDWLNYNYFDIFSLQAQKNNLTQSQSSKHNLNDHPLQQLNAQRKQKNTKDLKNIYQQQKQHQQQNAIEASGVNLMDSSALQLNNSALEAKPFFASSYQPQIQDKLHATAVIKQMESFQKIKKAAKIKKNRVANYQDNRNTTVNNNYLLQSKIINQSLTVFNRFLTLFILTSLNCIYFLIIIVYLTKSNDQLKVPVQMNQRSINLHIIMTNLKIATELLAFDYFILQDLWPDYQITSLQQFFTQMNASIVTLNQIQQQNTDILYGNNPFPPSIVNQLKDIQQGQGCQYLVTYPCQSYNSGLGIEQIISEKTKFVTEYPEVLVPGQTQKDQLLVYLNGTPHLNDFVFSFLSEDELFDVYNDALNSSISTVSLSIQNFLENYLIIAGSIFTGLTLLTIIIHWHLLYTRIQEMNLLLTIIPEDKLQEDVTLHMVRQLHRM